MKGRSLIRSILLSALCAFCLACAGEATPTIDGEDASADVAVTSDAQPDAVFPTDQPNTNDRPDTGVDVGVPTNRPLEEGDLIKGSGPAIYWLGRNFRRYVFPDEQTFFAHYQYYGGIRQITDEVLASIDIGGVVTVRAGTWLVKITTDPKVYAVTHCGVLHWIESEALARELFGPNWNKGRMSEVSGDLVRRTQDVPDAWFVTYSVGHSISQPIHPDGTLVRYGDTPERYVIMNGTRRLITPDAFGLNRFQEGFVVPTTIVYPDGPTVTGYERLLSDPVCIN